MSRPVIVPEAVTLSKLHWVLQATIGCTDSHLTVYEFYCKRYGAPDLDCCTSG